MYFNIKQANKQKKEKHDNKKVKMQDTIWEDAFIKNTIKDSYQ